MATSCIPIATGLARVFDCLWHNADPDWKIRGQQRQKSTAGSAGGVLLVYHPALSLCTDGWVDCGVACWVDYRVDCWWIVGRIVWWIVGYIVAWIVGYIVGWIVGWIMAWIIGWIAGWMAGRIVGWIGWVDCRVDGRVDCLSLIHI